MLLSYYHSPPGQENDCNEMSIDSIELINSHLKLNIANNLLFLVESVLPGV